MREEAKKRTKRKGEKEGSSWTEKKDQRERNVASYSRASFILTPERIGMGVNTGKGLNSLFSYVSAKNPSSEALSYVFPHPTHQAYS